MRCRRAPVAEALCLQTIGSSGAGVKRVLQANARLRRRSNLCLAGALRLRRSHPLRAQRHLHYLPCRGPAEAAPCTHPRRACAACPAAGSLHAQPWPRARAAAGPQEGAGHAVHAAYVEVVFDNSDNRFPARRPRPRPTPTCAAPPLLGCWPCQPLCSSSIPESLGDTEDVCCRWTGRRCGCGGPSGSRRTSTTWTRSTSRALPRSMH